MNELHLFAGAGGGILGSILLGHNIVGAVEIEEYPCRVLEQRQKDGCLPRFPIFQMDIREFNRRVAPMYQGIADIVSGGFPCQDISVSNRNACGITGERSGLWKSMYETICIIRPRFAFMENSSALVVRGLETVLTDMAEAGYDSRWICLRCSDVGGNHHRDRIWILSYPAGFYGKACIQENRERIRGIQAQLRRISWWKAEPDVLRVDDGLAPNVDRRIKAIGNGQVPIVAATAWKILSGE